MKTFLLIFLIKAADSPFKDLPHPDSFDFVIALNSDVGNNFEPCGCGNPPFRGGELSKRVFVIKRLKDKYGKKLLTFDTGNYVSPSSNRNLLKIFKDILKMMDIKAMAFLNREAISRKEDIEYLVRNLKYPYFNMNSEYRELLTPYENFILSGIKIYFTSYIPKGSLSQLPEYEKNIFDKLKEKLKKESSILFIVTPYNTELPFDSNCNVFNIIGNSSKFEVSFKKEKGIYSLTISRYGLYMPLLFFAKKGNKIEVKKVLNIPLDNKIEKDLEVEKLKEKWENMRKKEMEEIRKKFMERSQRENSFPLSSACKNCHIQEYLKWKNTKHSKAIDVLISLKKERDFKCLSCHTTGYGKVGGFQSMESSKELANIHCSECHYVDLRNHLSDKKAITYKEENCRKCHNQDQSPDFEYAKYWEKIRH
ncbi:MAG: cytochrome c family protein [candidate division WOR-3 bacterium]